MKDEFEKTIYDAHHIHTTLTMNQDVELIRDRVSAIRQILAEHPIPKESDHLFICQDNNGGYWFPLTQTILIGNGEGNDLKLNSKFISRHHCRIKKAGNGWVVEDLKSSNGVHVNKRKVDDYFLNYGDVIQIADECLIFFPKPSGFVNE